MARAAWGHAPVAVEDVEGQPLAQEAQDLFDGDVDGFVAAGVAQAHHVFDEALMGFVVLDFPRVLRQDFVPDRFFGGEVVLGIGGELAKDLVQPRQIGLVGQMAGQLIHQPDQLLVLGVDLRYPGLEIRIPRENLYGIHGGICACKF